MRFLTDNDKAKLQLVQVEPLGPCQLIEIQVTQTGLSKIPMPDIANLRNQADQIIVIKGLRVITDEVLTNAPDCGLVTAPLTELQKISLVLYSEQWQKGQNIPILLLNDITAPVNNAPYRQLPTKFDSWLNLDWNKSFMQYSNGTQTDADTPYAVILMVEYVKMIKNPADPTGQSYIELVGPN